MVEQCLLRVKDVHKHFGGVRVLEGVSFAVKKNEIFGIAGPNGAGKTTLLNVISGLVSSSGKVIFDGEQVNGLRADQMCHKGIARSYQMATVFPNMSVRDNIFCGSRFGNQMKPSQARKVGEGVLSFIRLLEGKEDEKPEKFKLFDLRLTMLAAALATQPKLLLLDEPAGGLAPKEVELLITLIRRIRNELGITIILIEHLMKVILNLCDQLLILHNGETMCLGQPDEVAKDQRVIDIYLGADDLNA